MQILDIDNAKESLNKGKVIAYPTEAVFGLGCDPNNDVAIQFVIDLKKRNPKKGLIVVGAILGHVMPFLGKLDEGLLNKVMQQWPGPVTWILPAADSVSSLITGEHSTIAVRVSAHPVVQSLCNSFGGAIVSTSANFEGEIAAKSQNEVFEYFPEIAIVEGSLGGIERPTKIIDGRTMKVLRD